MPIALIYGVTVAFGLLAWSVFAAQYLWPTMSKRERTDALRPILVLHSFRYVGMCAGMKIGHRTSRERCSAAEQK
jgi:hypothetical protein